MNKPPSARGDRTVFAAMATLAFLASIAAIAITARVNPLRGDSAEYLYFDPSRTVGYPAFLALVRALTGRVALAVPFQILILGGSLLFLAWTFHQLVRRPYVSFVFLAFLLLQAGMWFASAFIMTEALSTALVACWCAQLLRMLRAPRWRGCAALIAISAAGAMVRPSLVALFIGTFLFILFGLKARERASAAFFAVLGLLCAWAATPLAQLMIHGSARTTSPLARGVLQHSLYCEASNPSGNADFDFVEHSAAPIRRYIDSAPAEMHEQFRRAYSTPLRFGLIIPVLGRRHGVSVRSQVDPFLAPIAAARLRANPFCYIRSAANEYLRLTAFDTDPTSEDAALINGFMKSHPAPELPQYPVLPGDRQMALRAASEVNASPSGLTPRVWQMRVAGDVPLLALLPMRLIYALASVAGLFWLLLLAASSRLSRKQRQLLPATAAMGAAFHCALAITAIVEIGFYRYLMPFWPMVCTLVFLCALGLAEFANRRHATAAAGDASQAST